MADNDHRWRDERGRDNDRDRDFYGREEYRGGYYGREGERGRQGSGDYGYGRSESERGGGRGDQFGYGPQREYEGRDWRSREGRGSWRGGTYGGGYDFGDYGSGNRTFGSDNRSLGDTDAFGGGELGRGGGSIPRYGDYGRDWSGYDRGTPTGGTNYGSGSNRGMGGYGGRYRDDDRYGANFGRDNSFGNYQAERRQGGRSDWDRQDYGQARRRDYENEDRGWWDRATDEVASWFGDDEAERRRRLDARHQGRGPKGYKRSDDRIREDVSDRLTEDAYIDASEITVRVSNGEVTLEGTADTRMARRRAEDIAESISGVSHVQNNIRVKQGQDAGVSGASISSTQNPGSWGQSATATGGSTTTGASSTAAGGTTSVTGTNGNGSSASSGTGAGTTR